MASFLWFFKSFLWGGKVIQAVLPKIKTSLKVRRKEQVLRAARKESAGSTMTVFLSFAFLAAILTHIGCSNQRRSPENGGRRYNRIQHGQCAYTFILPEHDGNCRESTTDQYNTNALQRDAPHVEPDFSSQKLQHLEHVMENYTQWLQKVSDRFQFLIAQSLFRCCTAANLEFPRGAFVCLPFAPGGQYLQMQACSFPVTSWVSHGFQACATL